MTHLSSGGEGVGHGGVRGMGSPGSGKCRCKGPEAGNMPGVFEALGVAGTGGTGRRVGGDGVTRDHQVGTDQRGLFMGRTSAFTRKEMGTMERSAPKERQSLT